MFLSFCHLYPLFSIPCLFSVFRFIPASPSLLIYHLHLNEITKSVDSNPSSTQLSISVAIPSLTLAPLTLSIAPPLVPVAELPLTRSLLCLLLPSRSGAWCGISWESECSALARQLGCGVKVSRLQLHLVSAVCLRPPAV